MEEFKTLIIPQEKNVKKIIKLKAQLQEVETGIRDIVMQPENVVPFLVPGRVIKIQSDSVNWGWGVLVNWKKARINPKEREV